MWEELKNEILSHKFLTGAIPPVPVFHEVKLALYGSENA